MLFLILPLALCLVTAPLMTHHMMEAAYQRSREQIAVDNAAIVFGEQMAELVEITRSLEKARVLKEARHHAVHAQELALDMEMEMELGLWTERALTEIRARWGEAFILAQAKARELGVAISFEKVSPEDPVFEKKICPRCAKAFVLQWRPGRFPIEATLFSQTALRAGAGVRIDGGYRLTR